MNQHCNVACVMFQVHGDYKEDVGMKLERPAEDEVVVGQEVTAE